MTIDEVTKGGKVDVTEIPKEYYLLGLLSAFQNRFQAVADSAMKEISWKQFFAIVCINMCKEPPTLKELSDIFGSSHQNLKQILIKLEKKKFVEFQTDESDKRKQRIVLTKHCLDFCNQSEDMTKMIMEKMFDGIPKKDIETTIKTITRIEGNLRGV
ncbi:MAG: MarR family transcriptional regulator [Clostridiales bacterium]|nr:MarR family transcriptional regulator [Clostridiales bacterium]